MSPTFRMRKILPLIVAVVAVTHSVGASLRVRAVCVSGAACDVNGVVIWRAVRGGTEELLRAPMRQGAAELELAEGPEGELALSSDTHWAPPQRLSISAAAQDLRVWPAGHLTGRFAMESKGEPLPKILRIEIQSPPAVPGAIVPNAKLDQLPATSYECAIGDDGSWRCVVPRVTFDAVIRVKSFTPFYRWALEPSDATPLDLGRLLLRPAASAIAWLDAATLKALKKPARARLVRMAMSDVSELAERLNRPVAEAEFNERGMVQLSAVAPGEYTLEAEAPGFAVARFPGLRIFPRSESRLAVPIRLEPPLDIELKIVPAVDSSNVPWRLEIYRHEELTGRTAPVVRGAADEEGVYKVTQQPAGKYAVVVKSAKGDLYGRRELVIHGPADAQQTIVLALIATAGMVRYGAEPLAAELLFGGNGGREQIRAVADDEGAFRVMLPRAGEWIVDVENRKEQIHAPVRVMVEGDADDLEINIPGTEISGSVIQPDGERCANPEILLATAVGNLVARGDVNGEYRFRGIAPGRVKVMATDQRTGEASNTRELSIEAGKPLAGIDLQLLSEDDVRVTVWSQGQPVAGARVLVAGSGDGDSTVRRVLTDVDGSFTVPIKVTATQIVALVAAAGRTMQAFSFSARGDQPRLELEAVGGTLRLDSTAKGPKNVRLKYNGISLPIGELLGWARAQGQQPIDYTPWTIPNMAPGTYELCFTSAAGADTCVSETLARGGTLELATK